MSYRVDVLSRSRLQARRDEERQLEVNRLADKERQLEVIRLRLLEKEKRRLERKARIEAHLEYFFKMKLLDKYFILKYNLLNSTTLDNEFDKIRTIKLENLQITKAILDVLDKTTRKNITTIILRNITFDSVEICTEFLYYLSNNVNLKILILDNVIVLDNDDILLNFNELLEILGTFKFLEVLEFSGFNITELFNDDNFRFDVGFMTMLIKLDNLKFLIFSNNTIEKKIYEYLFNDYDDINLYYFLDLGDNKSKYLKYNDSIINKINIEKYPHFGDHYMYIIEIDTYKTKMKGDCVNRRVGIKIHTFKNKTETITTDKKDKLINYINENVLVYLKFYFKHHTVDDTTLKYEYSLQNTKYENIHKVS
jgi:hypothetical protein